MRSGWTGPAQVLDGKLRAAHLKAQLKQDVADFHARGLEFYLATVLVGDNPASHSYVRFKHADCAEIGVPSRSVVLPAEATQTEVLAAVDELNQDPACAGFIVQLPLPAHLDTPSIVAAVSPDKDIDGLHPYNLGRLVTSLTGPLDFPIPCTPRGCLDLLTWGGVEVENADICIVGNGLTAGRPLGLLASRVHPGATVTTCHVGTKDLAVHTKVADILISAAGVGGLIKPDMVRPGAAVLDVGVSRVRDLETGKYHLVGDVAEGVDQVARWLSPNPGGVGPMTRVMLLQNWVENLQRFL